jgi:hypothetical protein
MDRTVIGWFSVNNFCASDVKRAAAPRVLRQVSHTCMTESNCFDRYGMCVWP